MPKRLPTIGLQDVGGLLERMPQARATWMLEPDILAGLDTLEAAARSLLRTMKAHEHEAYQRLYHGSCPHHMSTTQPGGYHCSTHRQDACERECFR